MPRTDSSKRFKGFRLTPRKPYLFGRKLCPICCQEIRPGRPEEHKSCREILERDASTPSHRRTT